MPYINEMQNVQLEIFCPLLQGGGVLVAQPRTERHTDLPPIVCLRGEAVTTHCRPNFTGVQRQLCLIAERFNRWQILTSNHYSQQTRRRT